MRAFWIVLIVLGLAGGLWLTMGARSGSAPKAPAPTPVNHTEVTAPAASIDKPVAAEKPKPAPAPVIESTPIPATKPTTTAMEAPAAAPAVATAPTPPTASTSAPAAAMPSGGAKLAAPTKTVTESAPEPEPELTGEKVAGFDVSKDTIVQQDGGITLINGTFKVKGDGTIENPYRVPWELLTSVERNFDLRKGRKNIPQRVAMLNGKYVQVSGYIAFPVMSKNPKELLGMLNQWDGCCIGTPPTPYDAIEVNLKKAAGNTERFASEGSLTGIFKIKPYLQGNWLIGLYVMDQTELKVSGYTDGGT